ncbi:MAG: hypothetical protein IPJ74_24265 [Saprospiraceae bacterium]|nr:hypothetical protein [Saprospiraceae bacterium]
MPEEPKPKSTWRFSKEMIVALSANAVSIITLLIFIYQTNLMREQQHVAVWPCLEWLPSCCTEEFGGYLQVENKGIGPAAVQSVNVQFKGKSVNSIDELFTMAVGHSNFEYYTSTVESRVLAPGEKIKMFTIPNLEWASKVDSVLRRNNFEVEICYCSVYMDCWKCRGTSNEPVKKCIRKEVINF